MANGMHGAGPKSPAFPRLRRLFARLRDDRGVAAVEFALILPVMLGLYLSTIVTTKAYMATRKVALVARALADIASRQGVCAGQTNPCVTDADMTNFFNAASSIMAPYATSPLKMTLSRIDVMKDSAGNMWALTKWSVTNQSGVARACIGPNTAMAAGAQTTSGHLLSKSSPAQGYPLMTGDRSPSTSGFQNYLPPEYTNPGAPTGYLIVADVAYTYTPGFTFNVFNWSHLTTVNTGWSQAFWSRTGLPIESSGLSTNATVCTQNDPDNVTS